MKASLFPTRNAEPRFLRKMSFKISPLVARVIAFFLPEDKWYPATLALTRVLTFFIRPIIGLTPYRSDTRRGILEAWIMHAFLRHLPEFGRQFPIPIRTNGAEAVFEASTNSKGWVVLCVHLPLTQLILSALVEMRRSPTGVVSNPEALRSGKSPVWGKATGLPGLVSNGNVLLKVQGILNRGGSIATMVDTALDRPLNGNMLRLIGLAGARAVFSCATLQTSGEILVQFYALPDPYCRSEEAVALNVEFIQSKLDEILSKQGGFRSENHWPANQAPFRTSSR